VARSRHVQPITLDMVPATERDTSCDGSVVGKSKQSLRVASRADYVLFILQIPLSPTSLLTDVRGDVTMRKSVKHSFFVNNFQTVNVVYKDVLS